MTNDLELTVKISELDPANQLRDGDVLPIVQNGTTKKLDKAGLVNSVKSELGSAALANVGDFATGESVDQIAAEVQTKSNEQNERIDRIEYSVYLIRNNGVFKSYRTKAEMLADVVNIPIDSISSVVADPDNDMETNNINGQYHYNGIDFFKLPNDLLVFIEQKSREDKQYAENQAASALNAAKLYTDLFVKDVITLANNTSLNLANNFGHWLLPINNTYTDLPPNFVFDDTVVLQVQPSTGGFFEQRLHKLNAPSTIWARSCRVSDGVGVWREPCNRYMRVYDSVDPKIITFAGTYVITNPVGMPVGFKGTALLDIERYGGFTERTIKQTDGKNVHRQVGNGDWDSAQLTTVMSLPTGVSLNTANTFGYWLLSTANVYTDLPPNFVFDDTVVMEVLPSTGGYFEQRLHKLNSPTSVWARSCRISDGAGVWREPFNRFNRLFDGIDPKTITTAGTYVVSNPKGLPSDFVGSALVNIERFGGFTERTIKQTNGLKPYYQVNDGAWSSTTPTITNSHLAIDYAFRGLFTDADFNTFTAEGNYLANGIKINGPSGMPDTAKVTVSRMGAFVIQRATSDSTIDSIAQRRGSLAGGIWKFESSWSWVGAKGGTGNGSALAGKNMVVDGDSVVEQGDWPERVAARYGMVVHKLGWGGCRATYYPSSPLGYDKQCLYNHAKCINSGDFSSLIAGAEYTRDNNNDDNTPQAHAMAAIDWNTVDIFCIAFGTNDWTGNPVGTELVADPEGKTFKGAMCFSIEQIQAKYPHIRIVLIGMSFRLRGSGADESINSDNTPNTFGYYLKDYQKAILDIAEKYHLPALDMYRLSGVNEQTHKQYLRDGVHPISVTGYQHWADVIGSFLNSVL
ncbi:conserved hypothetical protein [Acinetobacter proteolyticus]|uniref:SGNH hydrolase-type esterase domain-containing protein n=1 Tax=Acinetobacter proteolyticus TaxID=1776741 RepID=A0A653K1R4_9GAMM|nr:SGNH/GDSL hydrolase family protein [Acinetobacter proteolyticus]VXA54677.1 conserved hypothetical protein [Acinetobacter proteolyticus]